MRTDSVVRRIRLPGAAIETSCLGLGCASLGSRISARAGIEALARAHDAGVTWFDVAPAYGAGEAEGILGQFLTGRRDKTQVLTKVGLAPPVRAGTLRLAQAALRPVAGVLRGLRRHTRSLSATRNTALAITPDLIETSIATSLRRLRTDHVDVLALHDPDPLTVTRDDICRALEAVVARGQARFVGVAGSHDACLAGATAGLPYCVFQTAVAPDFDVFADLRAVAGRPIATIGHSVAGVGGALDALVTRLRHEPAFLARARAIAGDGSERAIAARLLVATALSRNPEGVTLMSMFSKHHLAANLHAAQGTLDPRAATLLGNPPTRLAS
jgi:aryl-alcohol dehydrogenase-like predicted oxidoreductase